MYVCVSQVASLPCVVVSLCPALFSLAACADSTFLLGRRVFVVFFSSVGAFFPGVIFANSQTHQPRRKRRFESADVAVLPAFSPLVGIVIFWLRLFGAFAQEFLLSRTGIVPFLVSGPGDVSGSDGCSKISEIFHSLVLHCFLFCHILFVSFGAFAEEFSLSRKVAVPFLVTDAGDIYGFRRLL